jgi:hypothetical protein
MAFVKNTTIGVASVLAILGRKTLGAQYTRGIQYATDYYITYVGGAVLSMVGLVLLNACFLFMRWHGAQATLAIVGTILALYYLFAPKILTPLTALSVAGQAAEPGDQPNALMVRGGLKQVVSLAGTLLFAVDAYIMVTMFAPFHLYPEFFYLLHIPLLMCGLLLMTGHVPVDVKVYDTLWRVSGALVLGGILVVTIGRERILPVWAEMSAKRTQTALAELNAQSITSADKHMADWIKKNVRVAANGDRTVLVRGTDGTVKEVDAQPYIEQELARKEHVINLALGKEPHAADLMSDPVEWVKQNPVKFVILLVLHYPIVWLLKKRTPEAALLAGTTPVAATTSSGLSKWIIAILLGGGAYAYWDDPRVKDVTFRGGAPEVKTALMPTITPHNAGKFEGVFTTKNIHFPLPQHVWHGQKIPLMGDSYAGDNVQLTFVFDASRSFDITFTGTCIKGTGSSPRVCAGQYDAGQGYAGLWRGEWSIGGNNLTISLFKEDRNWEAASPIAEILVRLRNDG